MIFSSAPIPCDFEKYPTVGCEDSVGSYCDLESSRCHCKPDYPIRLFKYCLRYVGINETCYTSRQCNETFNAACYILGTEYDHSGGHNVGFQLSDWPEGKCRCRLGHQFDTNNGTCVKRTIGSWCNTDRDCTKENFHSFCNRKSSICECVYGYIYDSLDDTCSPQRLYGSKCRSSDDCSRDQLVCTGGRCKCPKGSHWDAIYPGSLCKPNNDSACAYGYRWDTDKERCVLKIYKDDDGEDLDGLDDVGLTGNDLRPNRGRGGNSGSSGDGGSLSMVTIVVIVLANIFVIFVLLRYWYIRKREDSEEDLTERGHIRPTLKPYYGDHLIHGQGIGVVPMGPIDANGIKCPLSVDDSVIDCDGMVKCASTSSSPGQHARNHHHHPIHPTLSDTIVPYGDDNCPIGHCQGHCHGHLDVLECQIIGCHQINGINMDCNLRDDLTVIESNIINGNLNDPNCLTNSPNYNLKSKKKETTKSDHLIGTNDDVDDGLGSLGNQEESDTTINDDNCNNQDVNSCQSVDKMNKMNSSNVQQSTQQSTDRKGSSDDKSVTMNQFNGKNDDDDNGKSNGDNGGDD